MRRQDQENKKIFYKAVLFFDDRHRFDPDELYVLPAYPEEQSDERVPRERLELSRSINPAGS